MQKGAGCKTDFRWEGKCSSPGCCKGGRRTRRKKGAQKKRKRDRIKAWFRKKFSRKKKGTAVPFIRELMPGREQELRRVRRPQPGPVQPGQTLTPRDKQRAKKKKKAFVVADSLNSVFDARLEERDRIAALDAAAQTVNADTPPPRRAPDGAVMPHRRGAAGLRPTTATGYTIYGSDAAAAESKRALLEGMGVLKPLEEGEEEDPARVRRAEEEVAALGVGGMADLEYEKAVRRKKFLKAIRDPPTRSPPPPPRRKSFGLGGRKRRKTRRGRKRRTRRRRRRGGESANNVRGHDVSSFDRDLAEKEFGPAKKSRQYGSTTMTPEKIAKFNAHKASLKPKDWRNMWGLFGGRRTRRRKRRRRRKTRRKSVR